MALLDRNSPCPICWELISDPIFATSGIFLPFTDPLFVYCDTCIHWSCYATWEHRERFAKAYVQMWVENERRNLYWARVFLDDFSFIAINPHPLINAAHVHLFRTGSRIDVPLREWEKYMRGERAPLVRHPLEATAWSEGLPLIREALPTQESLHEAADWSSKEKLAVDNAINELEQLAAIDIYNQGCEKLRKQLEADGLVCPRCRERTTRIRFYDKAPRTRSYFV